MWASSYSKAYTIRMPAQKLMRIVKSLRAFADLKQLLLLKIEAKKITIPDRAKKGKTLLETLLVSAAGNYEEIRAEIITLIEIREKIIASLMPYYLQLARSYLKGRADFSDPSGALEAIIEQAARQGIDRMKPDKVGIRVDFVISAVKRFLPELKRQQYAKSICLSICEEHWCREIEEDKVRGEGWWSREETTAGSWEHGFGLN